MMTADEEREFIDQFVEEAKEHIAILNQGFLSLEKNPEDDETLKQIFRSAHTIKGSSDALSLDEICHLAHSLEDLLDALRQKRIMLNSNAFTTLFNAVDMLNEMVDLTQAGHEITIDSSKVCEELKRAESEESATSGPEVNAAIPAQFRFKIDA